MSMDRYALIENGVITNVIESEEQPAAEFGEWVLVPPEVGPGWVQDGETFTPPSLVTAPSDLRITSLAMRRRFTSTERVQIEIAMLDDPSAAMEVRAQSAALRSYIRDMENAQFVALDDPDVMAGVEHLMLAGMLDEGRADAILNTPPTASELWSAT